MTFAQAAQRAIALGGKYDGHEVPAGVNKMTKASVASLAGQGLVAGHLAAEAAAGVFADEDDLVRIQVQPGLQRTEGVRNRSP